MRNIDKPALRKENTWTVHHRIPDSNNKLRTSQVGALEEECSIDFYYYDSFDILLSSNMQA
jgi:hypothetical protein